jgi:RNA ligase (TIGR02306 family)
MARKLASIQIIDSIDPIPGKDKIGVGHVLGWQVIVDKTSTRAGSSVVFLEIDSVLPWRKEWAFLESRAPFPYRLKTVKMGGVISQGLAIPATEFNGRPYVECVQEGEETGTFVDLHLAEPGTDLTDILGVIKYEVPEIVGGRGGGDTQAPFPWWIPQTDEVCVQSEPGLLMEAVGIPMYTTEKYDGSSLTVFWQLNDDSGEHEPRVCSRGRTIKEGTNWWWNAARNMNLLEKLKGETDVVYQGEIMGPGLQGNKFRLGNYYPFGFNLYSRSKSAYLDYDEMMDRAKFWDIPMVRTIDTNLILPMEARPDSGEDYQLVAVIKDPLVIGAVCKEHEVKIVGKDPNGRFIMIPNSERDTEYDSLVLGMRALGLKMDPRVDYAETVRKPPGVSLEWLLEYAQRNYADYPDVQAEGIVVRPMVEMKSGTLGGRFSFKVENVLYRLEND